MSLNSASLSMHNDCANFKFEKNSTIPTPLSLVAPENLLCLVGKSFCVSALLVGVVRVGTGEKSLGGFTAWLIV